MASFKELSGIMGEKAAVQLSVVFGGARIYVPVAADPDGWLSKAIGGAAANALCRAYGGEQTDIPVGPGKSVRLRERIESMVKEGKTLNQIARQLVLSEREVRKLLNAP